VTFLQDRILQDVGVQMYAAVVVEVSIMNVVIVNVITADKLSTAAVNKGLKLLVVDRRLTPCLQQVSSSYPRYAA